MKSENMENIFWNKLPLLYCPEWLKKMLISLDCNVVQDSDFLMWCYKPNRKHLQIEVDKILMYTKGNPLQYREYYSEE